MHGTGLFSVKMYSHILYSCNTDLSQSVRTCVCVCWVRLVGVYMRACACVFKRPNNKSVSFHFPYKPPYIT